MAIFPLSVLLFFVFVGIIIFWTETLFQVAGEDKKVWFYLIMFIPPLLLVYHLTNLR